MNIAVLFLTVAIVRALEIRHLKWMALAWLIFKITWVAFASISGRVIPIHAVILSLSLSTLLFYAWVCMLWHLEDSIGAYILTIIGGFVVLLII